MIPLSEHLQRHGAVATGEVVRLASQLCQALVRLAEAGTQSTVEVTSVFIDQGHAVVHALPFEGTARDQVRAVAAVAYELLKGAPPPSNVTADDFAGLRPELVHVLAPALRGDGSADLAQLGAQLHALGHGGTAAYQAPADTKLSVRQALGAEGQVFGSWELVRRLGEGGMGEVYAARHVKLGREVAVKLLRPEFAAQPEIVQRFFQEARVVNELKHPNIVEIFDFIEEPGRVYLVMELLVGRTLADLARDEGPLPLDRTCRVLSQACSALEAAHARGIVHRDIKPENLFVGPDDRLKVLDFGVARRLDGSTRTQAGMVIGTPFYMAPEQAAGRAVDGSADLYALGATLYELVAHTSFGAVTTPQRLTRSARGEAVPAALANLVEQLLAFDPSRRPTARAARERLVTALRPPSGAVSPELLEQAGLVRRRSAPVAAVALSAVVVAALALWGLRAPDEPAPVAAPPALAPVPLVERPTPEPTQPAPAPPSPPKRATRTKPVESAVRPPEPAPDPSATRLASIQRRWAILTERYGAKQLTTLERAVITEALEREATGEAITAAEEALAEAERRLTH